MKLIRSKVVWLTLAGVLAVEVFSGISYIFPGVEPWFFGIVVLGVFGLSIYSLRAGVAVTLAELIISSKGHLLDFPIFDQEISMRMGLFAVILLATGYHIFRERKIHLFKARTEHLFILLGLALLIGFGVAFIHSNPASLIYLDGNGYLYLLLIFPFYQAIKEFNDIKLLVSVMIGALIASLIKTGLLLLAFSHNIPFLPDINRWIRVTGVGEITALEGSYRIFFQSHIYALILLGFVLAFLLITFRSKFTMKRVKPFLILGSANMAAIILSGSRALWVTLIFVGLVFILTFTSVLKTSWPAWKKFLGMATFIGFAGILWIAGLVSIPIPGLGDADFSTSSLLSERTTETGIDASSSSRFALLGPLAKAGLDHPILGSGFGSTITYKTSDPRYLDQHPDGLYTTYAFEWGYLDIIYKTGIVGLVGWLVLFFGFITYIVLLVRKERKPSRQILLITSGLGLVVIFGIHMLTPYLNHPLGIGWILFTAVVIESSLKEHA